MNKTAYNFILIALLLTTNVYADTTPPITKYTQQPEQPNNQGYYTSSVNVNLDPIDLESGPKTLNYKIDNGSWQQINYTNTLNLITNPSFEVSGETTTGMTGWELSQNNPSVTVTKDADSTSGFGSFSAKITSNSTTWSAINNSLNYAVVQLGQTVQIQGWIKTQNVSQLAAARAYAISTDKNGTQVYTLIGQSTSFSGTNSWKKINFSVPVNISGIIGIYLDLGIQGTGTVWFDAFTVNMGSNLTEQLINIPSDTTQHTLSYYTQDNFNNTESYSCDDPVKNCITYRFLDPDIPDTNEYNGFVRTQNKGIVRSNRDIKMQGYEQQVDDNTDSLIEVKGNIIDNFESIKEWKLENNSFANINYDDYSEMFTLKIPITQIPNQNGVYIYNGNLNINTNISSNVNKLQIIFVDGNLTISRNISNGNDAKTLFIVKGRVNIDKSVTSINVAILSDGSFYTAYNVTLSETVSPLRLEGIYAASKFYFQRNASGNNKDVPTELFIYDPRYVLDFDDLMMGSEIKWVYTE